MFYKTEMEIDDIISDINRLKDEIDEKLIGIIDELQMIKQREKNREQKFKQEKRRKDV